MHRLQKSVIAEAFMISFSWLALSVTFGATSPKGRGLGKEMKFAWTAKGSPFEERLPPRRGKMSRSDKRGNLAS